MKLILKCDNNKLFKAQRFNDTMKIGKTFVESPHNYLEIISAPFFDENGTPIEEEVSGEYGMSFGKYEFTIKSSRRNQNKKPSGILVPVDSFNPIFVPASEVREH